MKRLAIIVLAISFFLAAPVGVSGQNGHNKRSKAHEATYVPGELLVKYKPAVRATATKYFRSRWGVSTLRRFRRVGVQHVKLPRNMTVEEALEIYRNDPDVEYVEPNYRRYATASRGGIFCCVPRSLIETGELHNEIANKYTKD